jgi:hypothetical protein
MPAWQIKRTLGPTKAAGERAGVYRPDHSEPDISCLVLELSLFVRHVSVHGQCLLCRDVYECPHRHYVRSAARPLPSGWNLTLGARV